MWLALRSVRLRRGSAEPCPGLVGIPCLYNADEGQRFPEGPCAAGGADHGEADAQMSPGHSRSIRRGPQKSPRRKFWQLQKIRAPTVLNVPAKEQAPQLAVQAVGLPE